MVFSVPFVGLNKASVKSEGEWKQMNLSALCSDNSSLKKKKKKSTTNCYLALHIRTKKMHSVVADFFSKGTKWKAKHLQRQRGCSPWPRCTQRGQAKWVACCSHCAGRCDENLQGIKKTLGELETRQQLPWSTSKRTLCGLGWLRGVLKYAD